jgi:hypothetical protein
MAIAAFPGLEDELGGLVKAAGLDIGADPLQQSRHQMQAATWELGIPPAPKPAVSPSVAPPVAPVRTSARMAVAAFPGLEDELSGLVKAAGLDSGVAPLQQSRHQMQAETAGRDQQPHHKTVTAATRQLLPPPSLFSALSFLSMMERPEP